jgi:mannosylglycerate hydrolase
VPHTHWDREWYSPFQTFRLLLVDLLDDLLPRLDADPSYAHFMLDGQMAVVDDYLEVRPEAEPTIRRLAASGRLGVGPWYILMDEFGVSGECMVRNLQLGLDRAGAFGGGMPVGYLPDMFGHAAQMPQLLCQAGFEHAVVWRGVPAAIDRSAFWWSAPDGSTLRAEYLLQGYGNGAYLPDDAKALVDRIGDFADDWDTMVGDGPILWMNGTDHLMPQPWLGRVVAEANDLQDDWSLAVTSLADYLGAAPTDGLPRWTGELRSGARANLLMGVASNRVDLHQAEARASRALEQEAEPLSALALPPSRWPAALLHEAWLHCIRNSAHDSICGCSVDEVADAVLYRYAEATAIAAGLAERATTAIGAAVAGDGPVVVNPSPRARSGIVEVTVPGEGPRQGAQVLEDRPRDAVLAEMDLAGSAAVLVRELKHNARLRSISLELVDTDEVLWHTEREGQRDIVGSSVRQELDEVVASTVPGRVRIRVSAEPTQRLLVRVADVPPYGWRAWRSTPDEDRPDVDPVIATDDSLDNGLLRVTVASDGTWAIGNATGLGHLVRGGDAGDTYNWCPPSDDVEIDRPESVAMTIVEPGPLRARLEIVARYRWPASNDGPPVDVPVTTTLELHAGSTLVHVRTEWDNRCRDQRVRAWFPLPVPDKTSQAECAFAIVERGLVGEGGPTEAPMATFPSRRFVRAGGLTIVHEGLLEYELVDIRDGAAHAVALTLLRATGMLSQGPMATRPLPAGPLIPMEGPQLQRPLSLRYAVSIDPDTDPYALVDEAFLPLRVTTAGGGPAPTTGTAMDVELGSAQVSSLRRIGASGALELRVFNPGPEPTSVVLAGRRGWLVDLRGRPVEPFDESFAVGPWRIATAVVSDS